MLDNPSNIDTAENKRLSTEWLSEKLTDRCDNELIILCERRVYCTFLDSGRN